MKTVYYLLLGLCLATAACKPDEPEMPEMPAGNSGNIKFTYDSITATLTIFGTGEMEDYDDIDAPWKPYRTIAQTFIIKDGVTSIGNRAFYNYPILAQVNIGNTVTSIREGAFDDCYALTQVTIGNSVTSIGKYAFSGCLTLKEITIPNSVTSIGFWAFSHCYALTKVNMGNGVTSIKENAFNQTALYNNAENWTNNVLYIGDCLIEAKDEVGNNYEILPGTRIIADNAFTYSNSDLTQITIPGTVTHIGDEAFSGIALTEVTLPNGLIHIGYRAFRCIGLREITIPSSVTSIEGMSFFCESLTTIHVESGNPAYCSIDGILFNKDKTKLLHYPAGKRENTYTIPDGVTDIEKGAFSYCYYALTQVTLPNSVTNIGDEAFSDCYALTQVTIGNGVTSIGDGAFSSCSKLTQVNIPNSVTSIGDGAFSGCSALTQVTIPDGVTSIGERAFYGCRALAQVTIGKSVTNIGNQAFSWCDALTAVYYTGDVTGWCGITFGNSSDSNPLFYAHNLYIGNTLVTDLAIPEDVTEIKAAAFCGCSATQVTIPESVKSIEAGAFANCSALTGMTVLATTPPKIEDGTFNGIRRSIPVYVPAEALEAYRATVIWNGFNLQAISY